MQVLFVLQASYQVQQARICRNITPSSNNSYNVKNASQSNKDQYMLGLLHNIYLFIFIFLFETNGLYSSLRNKQHSKPRTIGQGEKEQKEFSETIPEGGR